MKYLPIDPDLFRLNRRRFTQFMQPNTIAIFQSNDLMPRNGDAYFPFRQNSHLFYLSGLDQEETVLVLFPDCVKEGFQELAFIKRSNEVIRRWDGYKYSKEDARQASGIQRIYWLDEMEPILRELILLAEGIYLNSNENDRFLSEVSTRHHRFAHQIREQYPLHQVYRAQPILRKLSMLKSQQEVALIQQAIDITEKAFRRVLEVLRPGMWEFEVEAEILATFLKNRATGPAYSSIVASGPNSCVLHYIRNNRQCKEGDLLLMDFGAEYANYAADMTRTIPVSGQFSPRQRSVYESVLRVLKEATKMLVPGTSLEEYHKEVGKLMEAELLNLKLLDKTDIKNQHPQAPAYKKYFMHGTSHHLGLDVHDLSSRYAPLQAGMVFTCEPGIYIEAEGMGIRLENDILVTDQGPVNLMDGIPIEVEAIEELMQVEAVQS